MLKSFRKIEIITTLFNVVKLQHQYTKTYTITPNGETAYKYKSKKSCYRKTFYINPSDVQEFYNEICFLMENANDDLAERFIFKHCYETISHIHKNN